MNASFQLALPIVLALLCLVVTGNYMINQKHGMCPSHNLNDTKMWGVSFFIYAVFDYFLLLL